MHNPVYAATAMAIGGGGHGTRIERDGPGGGSGAVPNPAYVASTMPEVVYAEVGAIGLALQDGNYSSVEMYQESRPEPAGGHHTEFGSFEPVYETSA